MWASFVGAQCARIQIVVMYLCARCDGEFTEDVHHPSGTCRFPLLEEEKKNMRFTRVGYALGVAAAVAVFAGCSGNGSSSAIAPVSPGAGTQSVLRGQPAVALPKAVINQLHLGAPGHGTTWQGARPDATTTYVTVCGFSAGVCNLYKRGHNTVVGTISASSVNGICVDKAGNVWIPDGSAQTITEYPHGSTSPGTVLTGIGQQPSWCAVDSNGTVYVGNIAGDDIAVYPAGHTTATKTLLVKSAYAGGSQGSGYVIGVAVNETPNLHTIAVSWIDFNTGASGVDEFNGARQASEKTVVSGGSDFLGGVTFDNAENLVMNDQTAGTVDLFPAGGGTMTCSFSYNPTGNGSGDAVQSALDKTNGDDYLGDAVNNRGVEETYSPTCSGAGTTETTYSAGFVSGSTVIGVAVSPGATR